MKPILIAIITAVAVMSLVSFWLMYYDKQCARRGKHRVPEKTLFLAAALFGALGGTAGMWIFRHKTKHWYFVVFFPLMLFVQAAVIGYAVTKLV